MQAKMVDLAADLATSDIQATRIIRIETPSGQRTATVDCRSSAKAVGVYLKFIFALAAVHLCRSV